METYQREGPRHATEGFRRRSPSGNYERRPRPPRNRSRSPVAIDRYQPDRPDRTDRSRDEYYRGRDDAPRRRSPPPVQAGIDRYVPGQEAPAPIVTTNPLPNPLSLDFQVGFNWFAEWWRMDQLIKEEKERQKNGGRRPERLKGEKESREERNKEREQIQVAYDAYKEKLQMQMARTFVQQHKGEEWFKERYDPQVREPLRKRLTEFRKEAYNRWQQDISSGYFDEFTLEGIYKNESNGAGGIVEKEEGETIAANEVLGVGDLLPSKGGDLRDDAAQQPTLLLKTIAPTVSREKMEHFCKEHLGEGEGGYKWLSLSDPNPQKKCHRIGWVILNPQQDQPWAMDERGDGRDEEEEEGAVRSDNGASGPRTTAAKALDLINGKTIHDEERGDFTCHVGVHEPPSQPRKKALWDLFSAPERIERDLQLVTRLANKLEDELGEDYSGVALVEQRVEEMQRQGLLQPPFSSGSKKAKSDPEDPDEVMEEGEEGEAEEEGAYDEDVDDEELLVKKKKLDLTVEYLRRVFNFCFFCVFESDSVHELMRKCPGGHLRRPRASLTTAAKVAAKASAASEPFPFKKQESSTDAEGVSSPVEERKLLKGNPKSHQQLQRAFNWVKTYEDKLFQILEPASVDLKKIGGKPADEGLEEELNKFVKQEDEAKYRCKVPECTKLFKGANFWRKHVEKRHPEFYEKLKTEVDFVNAYVLDPAHIAPSRTDANSNGHFPVNNHSITGTPRGFNLSNIPFAFNAATGGVPNPAAVQAYFAQNNMAPPPGWPAGAAGAMMGAEDDRRGGGPIRRFNNRQGNRLGNPYDRPSKDMRNARWNSSSGRLTPPRVGGQRMPIDPRFADPAALVGPREAVQGRTLRSYEDLDAAGANGSEELNY